MIWVFIIPLLLLFGFVLWGMVEDIIDNRRFMKKLLQEFDRE